MPRKATVATERATGGAEPRRSSRIKDLPKPEPVKKKSAKPRAKKVEKDKEEQGEDNEDKPKSSRGRKRKEPEEPNGAPAGEGEEPPAKKVRSFIVIEDTIAEAVPQAKPPSKASAKPTSKVADKPSSKASAKPASTNTAKPVSGTGSVKPASRAGSKKPASKVRHLGHFSSCWSPLIGTLTPILCFNCRFRTLRLLYPLAARRLKDKNQQRLGVLMLTKRSSKRLKLRLRRLVISYLLEVGLLIYQQYSGLSHTSLPFRPVISISFPRSPPL